MVHIVMAYTITAHLVMTYIVMARRWLHQGVPAEAHTDRLRLRPEPALLFFGARRRATAEAGLRRDRRGRPMPTGVIYRLCRRHAHTRAMDMPSAMPICIYGVWRRGWRCAGTADAYRRWSNDAVANGEGPLSDFGGAGPRRLAIVRTQHLRSTRSSTPARSYGRGPYSYGPYSTRSSTPSPSERCRRCWSAIPIFVAS